MKNSSSVIVAWIFSGVAILTGCGSPPADKPDEELLKLRIVGSLYGKYLANHAGTAPANESQLVAALERDPDSWKKVAATPQELLTSPRDGERLVIVYGAAVKDPPEGGFPWVAHEKTGVDGHVVIVNLRGSTELKEQPEVAKIFPK